MLLRSLARQCGPQAAPVGAVAAASALPISASRAGSTHNNNTRARVAPAATSTSPPLASSALPPRRGLGGLAAAWLQVGRRDLNHNITGSSTTGCIGGIAAARTGMGVGAGFRGGAARRGIHAAAAMRRDDPYKILGVNRGASDGDIKKKYIQLAKKLHPDTAPADKKDEYSAKFAKINEAYDILKDPERKRIYDMSGDYDAASGASAGNGNPYGAGGQQQWDAQDIFETIFGGANRAGGGNPFEGFGGGNPMGPMRGSDEEVQVDISFAEAVTGTTKRVSVNTLVACKTCKTSGCAPGTHKSKCSACDGRGEQVRRAMMGMMMRVTCAQCQGAGQVIETPCNTCGGQGRHNDTRVKQVKIPAGVDTGATLRMTGEGEAGSLGAPAGNLYIHLQVGDDPYFHRDGADVHVEVPITIAQAALGGAVRIRTLKGEVELKVPAGTQSEDRQILRGKAFPVLSGRGKGHGDQYVHFKVVIPKTLTDKQVEALKMFAEDDEEQLDHSACSHSKGFFAQKIEKLAGWLKRHK